MCLEVILDALTTQHGRVLPDLLHHFHQHVQRPCHRIGVETHLQLSVVILLGVVEDEIEDFSEHAAADLEGGVQVVFVSE